MIKKASTDFIPGIFLEFFESEIGKNVSNYLNSQDGINKMKIASEAGNPAEDSVIDILYEKFGDELFQNNGCEAISHRIKNIMENFGYKVVERDFIPYKNQILLSTHYKKTENRKGVLDVIGLGATVIYKSWLESKDTNSAKFNICAGGSKIIVEITGKAVFENLEPTSNEDVQNIVFASGSCYTILSSLTVKDIYLRIKDFYTEVLHACCGKLTPSHRLFTEKYLKTISPGSIEDSERYIQSLPDNPTNSELSYLCVQITHNHLKYSSDAKDKSGVKMHQYAEALEKKIIASK